MWKLPPWGKGQARGRVKITFKWSHPTHKAILQMYRNSKEINLAKLNLRICVEVLTLPVATEPTLRATVHVQFSSHCTTGLPQRAIFFCKHVILLWTFGLLSLIVMFRYIHFPDNTRKTKVLQKKRWYKLLNNLNFLFAK